MKKYLAASIAVFAWFLVFDNLLSGAVIGSAIASIPGLNPNASKLWETVGDLCAALVLCGLYGRVRSVFGEGIKGGAIYGFYAGLLVNFPTWLNLTNYFGWPYRATWHLTLVATVLYVVSGAIAGAVYKAVAAPKPAA
jgi:hypothetical protein